MAYAITTIGDVAPAAGLAGRARQIVSDAVAQRTGLVVGIVAGLVLGVIVSKVRK